MNLIQPDHNTLLAKLEQAKRVVIITHTNPDGDAMGSALGWWHVLKTHVASVHVVVPNVYPEFLAWMSGADQVVVYDRQERNAKRLIQEADVVFCLDFNHPGRVDKAEAALRETKAFTALIDHHLQPDPNFHWSFSDVQASSTCELVVRLIQALGWESALSPEAASCLYTGMMTDTGSFRFSSCSAHTHRMVAALLDAGANHVQIHEAVFDTNSEQRMKLLGHCLAHKMEVLPDYRTAFISVTLAEQAQFGISKGDTEGFVNQGLAVKGIKFAAFFMEKDGEIKISFRSKGGFDVNSFARKHFDGGGHFHAAGARSTQSLDLTLLKFIELLPAHRHELEMA